MFDAKPPGIVRRWGPVGLVAAVALWLVLAHRLQAEHVAAALQAADPRWLVGAAVLQLVFHLALTAVYQTAFAVVGVPSGLFSLVPVLLGSLALNVAVQGSGAALFLRDAARRGQSAARAAAGCVLVRVVDFATFALVLLAALVYLVRHHDLRAYELLGAAGLLAVIAGWAGLLGLGVLRPAWLKALLRWVQRLATRVAGWLRRPPPLPDGWPERTAAEYAEAAALCLANPRAQVACWLLALLAHGIDIASVWALCRAFGQPATVGQATAAFAIGVLFWIVAVTPQGIGVVEGAMALCLASLAMPPATATAIALAFRGLTFWLPMVVGFVLLPRLARERPPDRDEALAAARRRAHWHSGWPVALAAGLTAVMGLVNVASAVTPSLRARVEALRRYFPVTVRHGSHLTAALAGLALLGLAHGLARRKRAAHSLALLALAVSIVGHLLKGLDWEEATLSASLLLYLVVTRAWFFARSDRPSLWQALRVALAALAFTVLYGALGFYLLDRHFRVDFGLRAAIHQTLVMLTEFYDPGLEPITGWGRWFADSIYAIGAYAGLYAIWMVLRPVLMRQPATAEERARAAVVVRAHGRTALARMALFEDKRYWFSPGGTVFAYVVKGRVALVLGDPIGPPEDAAGAIAEFGQWCRRRDWLPAYYEAQADYLDAYAAAGLQALCIGNEAVVELTAFTLEGKAGRPLRTPVNRLSRDGYRAEVHQPPHPADVLEELRDVSDEWLTIKHGNEKRFALGWFDEEYLNDTPMMAVHNPEGLITAFANLVPYDQGRAVTIDLMRHRASTPNGLMDFLFVALLQWAREAGYTEFALGLSALSGVGRKAEDPAVERALAVIYEHVNRFYNFKGLHAFKAKFGPRWEPRYLVHPGLACLPQIWTAIMRANGGDDFVSAYLRR